MKVLWAAACAVLVATEVHAASRPDWLDRPPAPDSTYLYVIGEGEARSRSDAEKQALRDALDRLAQQISVTVSARTISVLATKGSQTVSEQRQAVRSRIVGAEPVGAPYVQVKKRGIFLFRRPAFLVKVLVRYPKEALAEERQRQESSWTHYKSVVDGLAHEITEALRKSGLGPGVSIGGFREAVSERAYSLSGILAKDLADSLVQAGITVAPGARATVSGNYRVVDETVVVTARLRRAGQPGVLTVAEGIFDKNAIPPAWLDLSAPVIPEFEALEPERADLSVRYGVVAIDSKPQGARVFLDGQDHGQTPLDLRQVPVGTRAILLLAEDFEPFQTKVEVMEGDKAMVDATLRPKTGDLEVHSQPPGAEVFVEREVKVRGRTPLTLQGLRLGLYRLELRLKDHDPAVVDLLVQYGQTERVAVTMTEQPGSLFVVSDPPGATILIDGAEVGVAKAPRYLRVDNVRAGVRQVEALISGRGAWRGEAVVRANRISQVTATVTDQKGTLLLALRPSTARILVGDREWDALGARVRPVAALPGMSKSPSASRWASIRAKGIADETQLLESMHQRLLAEAGSQQATLSIPLVEGEHEIRVVAAGYRPETKSVSIRRGRIKKLAVKLRQAKEPAGAMGDKPSLMPLTKDFIDECKKGDYSTEVKVTSCIVAFPLVTVISLGTYPLVADFVALPFRVLSRSYRFVMGSSGQRTVATETTARGF